jgi:hypothetical protein
LVGRNDAAGVGAAFAWASTDPLVHEVMGVPDRMIIQQLEAFVPEALIERPGLELECIQPRVFASACTGLGFGASHEFSPVATAAISDMDPKGADMKPARLDYADQAAPDFALTVSQENVEWLPSIRNARRVEVEAMERFFHPLDVLRLGIGLV